MTENANTGPAPCECSGPAPVWCARHGRHKGPTMHDVCRRSASYRALWDASGPPSIKPSEGEPSALRNQERVQASPMSRRIPIPRDFAPGPGTQLENLLKLLGIAPRQGCGCASLRAEMDRWGIQGCTLHRDAILERLRNQARQYSWRDRLKAAALAAVTGLAFKLDPLDPFPGLLDEALRRAERHELQFVRTEQLVRDAVDLANKLPSNAAGIIGIARSGVIPASLIATHLHLPLWIFRQSMGDIIPAGHGYRLGDRKQDGPLVFIDDTCMTGNSVRQARDIAAKRLGGQPALFAVVYRNPDAQQADFDFWARELPHPHFLEWNLFNSIHLPRMAFDFDGILTRDGSSTPQYLPRRTELRLIITGRTERLRAASLHWLGQWGVSVRRMIMWTDGPTPTDPLVIARWKAEHFGRSTLRYFVESCPVQAQEIARLSRKRVICPAAAKVF